MSPARLALRKLRFGLGRTFVAMAGISLATILLFFQFGGLGSVFFAATLLFDHLKYDIILVSGDYSDLSKPSDFQTLWLIQSKAVPMVKAVYPVTIGNGLWRDLQDEETERPEMERRSRQRWGITVIGIDPAKMPEILRISEDRPFFDMPDDLPRFQAALGRLDTVLMDRLSRDEFGSKKLLKPGVMTELNGRSVELVGFFQIGLGFTYTGLLMTSEETLFRYFPKSYNRTTLGLIQLEPGSDVDTVKKQIQDELNTSEVKVFTREELNDQEKFYWINSTAIGQIFALGVAVAMFVGFIFVTQMMTGDVRKHLPEFATMKAMGYRPNFLSKIVLWQAFFLAGGGFVVGFFASLGAYELIREMARMPVHMDLFKFLMTFVLVIGMCMASGLWALRRVHEADPAELF
jgi:putative ABC transport system permease protein